MGTVCVRVSVCACGILQDTPLLRIKLFCKPRSVSRDTFTVGTDSRLLTGEFYAFKSPFLFFLRRCLPHHVYVQVGSVNRSVIWSNLHLGFWLFCQSLFHCALTLICSRGSYKYEGCQVRFAIASSLYLHTEESWHDPHVFVFFYNRLERSWLKKRPEGLLMETPSQIIGFLRKGVTRGGNGPTKWSSYSPWQDR